MRKQASKTYSEELSLKCESASTFVFPTPALMWATRMETRSGLWASAGDTLHTTCHLLDTSAVRDSQRMTSVNSERKAVWGRRPLHGLQRLVGDENCVLTLPLLESHPLLVSQCSAWPKQLGCGRGRLPWAPHCRVVRVLMGLCESISPGALSSVHCNVEGPVSHLSHHTQRAPHWGLCTQRRESLDTLLGDTGSNRPRRDLPPSPWFPS